MVGVAALAGVAVGLAVGAAAIAASHAPPSAPARGDRAAASDDYTISPPPFATPPVSATIEPGNFDIGNHGDDVVTTIVLPFPFKLYRQTYTQVTVSSNGNLQFASADTQFQNTALPYFIFNFAILPYWDDLRTDFVAGAGIFTAVFGSAPNRRFVIEWRACLLASCGSINTRFEVRLFEGQDTFEVIYGSPLDGGGDSATVGVQRDTGSRFTQYSFNSAPLFPNSKLTFTLPPPTGVTGVRLEARRRGARVVVVWRTVSETNLVGFNVWRSGPRGWRKLNRELIPSVFGGTASGHAYSWLDRRPTRGTAMYRLQAVSLSGMRTWVGSATVR